MKIIFFGSSNYVIPIIEVLKKNFDLALVVTTEKTGGAIPTFCEQNQIKYSSVSSSSDLTHHSSLIINNSPVAVLADFGLIIPQDILNVFPQGIINLHPSLLPKYRGPTPVQTAILDNVKTTGISIMKVDEKVDHGPILAQEKEEILDTDTAETLYKRLFDEGANLLPDVLNKYLSGKLKPIAQNHKEATFTKSLTRQSGFIELSKLKIKNYKLKIARMVRAYFPWPGVWFKAKINGIEKIIKLLPNPLIAQEPNDPILIQVEGKKPVTYKDFLNGYPEGKEILSKISL